MPAFSRQDEIANVDPRIFERAIVALQAHIHSAGSKGYESVVACCEQISIATELGGREQDRRTSVLLNTVIPSEGIYSRFAELATTAAPAVRNAIAKWLPSTFRQSAYAGASPRSAPAGPASEPVVPDVKENVDAASPLSSHAQVLLVGTHQEHAHNIRFLETRNIAYTRAATSDQVTALLADETVAVLIARSCWTALPAAEHEAFIQKICQFSSFALIKVDVTDFSPAVDFDKVCSLARCRSWGLSEVSRGDSVNLTDTDLPLLHRASQTLDSNDPIHLYPADIPSQVAKLLIAGVAKRVGHRFFPREVHLQRIGTETMQGGRSQALLVQAFPDDHGPPLVVKVAKLPLLREEMDRFIRFIKPWDNVLNPELHFHNENGVLLFGLVESAQDPSKAAPTLENCLVRVMQNETGTPGDVISEANLTILLRRTVEKIKQLNLVPCAFPAMDSWAWLGFEPIQEAMQRGVDWTFIGGLLGADVIAQATTSADGIVPHCKIATIHGDAHLRNVLVRDERDPFLIDYAYSGPGHPCYDLVWLESAIMFRFFRMVTGEESLVSLFLRMKDPLVTYEQISQEFGTECTPVLNRVAIRTSLACRAACRELLERYALPFDHYRAMKRIVACQSLIRFDVQAGVVRAAVSAEFAA